jgi:Concanavalin A-like lectin/glucanases superfamily/EPTP domain/PKD domain
MKLRKITIVFIALTMALFLAGTGGYAASEDWFSEYQAIPTDGARDWESFEIGGVLYLAVANYCSSYHNFNIDSKIYKWNGSSFVEFQAIPTNGALAWESFEIGGVPYLAVANSHNGSTRNINSKIYKWNGTLFVEFQAIPTNAASDWESFEIGGDTYLAVANFENGSTRNIDSKIYKWNGSSFVEFQAIPTNSASDWESFEIGGDTYLAVANQYNGSTHNIDSRIYKWNGSSFVEFQAIPTNHAFDWESFEIGGDTYLAVANHYNDSTNNIDSKIYKWNGTLFVEFQAIPTNGASDWESFEIGGVPYLAVANTIPKIYKWNGTLFVEFQAIPTNGADWESFEIGGDTYLAVANFFDGSTYNIDSKIYKAGDGLIAYYPFNGNANDESGNGNNGIVHGATLIEDRCGNPNSAYSFNGQDTYIEVPDSPSLDITGPISLATWVKADFDQYFRVGLIDKRPGIEPSGGYDLVMSGEGEEKYAGFDLVVSNSPLPSIFGSVGSNTGVNDNKWHHIVGTYDSTYMKIYIDGILQNSVEYNNGYVANDVPLYISLFPYGYNDGHGNEPNILNGLMDEVMIYNRALSADEIQELYTDCPNSPPIADAGGPYLGPLEICFDGTGSFDPNGDPLTYAWDFGDENTGSGSLSCNTYADPYIYDVCLTVNDGTVNSEEVCTLAVVYDPSAGFVTGGGWIDSPAGAYKADETITGKANFGFVSKYKKGTTVPTGQTEFQFQTADLNFHSDSYDWLVVTGSNYAKFKGAGTINDAGDYKFMLWAGDDEPDTFRIKIWEEDEVTAEETVIYDNGPDQAIGGGAIVIHTKIK